MSDASDSVEEEVTDGVMDNPFSLSMDAEETVGPGPLIDALLANLPSFLTMRKTVILRPL